VVGSSSEVGNYKTYRIKVAYGDVDYGGAALTEDKKTGKMLACVLGAWVRSSLISTNEVFRLDIIVSHMSHILFYFLKNI
jgi:hypothetical protein